MPQSLRKKTGKKPGGQKGTTGKHCLLVEKPDQIVAHRPEFCLHCQIPLQNAQEITYSRRQVFEMPNPHVVVTEHRALRLRCRSCSKETQASFLHLWLIRPIWSRLLGFATTCTVSTCFPLLVAQDCPETDSTQTLAASHLLDNLCATSKGKQVDTVQVSSKS